MVQSVLDAKSKKQFNSISAYEEALTNFTVSEPVNLNADRKE